LDDSLKSVLDYDEWQHTLEDELLDACHEDYEYGQIDTDGINGMLIQSDFMNYN